MLSVAPDRAVRNTHDWPADLARQPQGQGDLGVRMARAMAHGTGPVVLIGSDIPGVGRDHIAHAFTALRTSPSVIGPAKDGGFWLVGLRRGSLPVPGLFDGVRWSGKHALADTLHTFGDLRIGFAATLNDVDTGEDLAPGHPHSGG